MQSVGDLAGQLHRLGATHRAHLQRQVFLHRTGCRRHPGVAVEVALEVDRALVEDRSHHLMRLAQPGDRTSSTPLDAVLLEHRDVADPEHDLGAPAAQLIERGSELSDIGRLPHVDRRHAGAESDPLGALRRGGEQKPGVLVVDLVGAVTPVVAEPIRERDRVQKLGRRLLGKHLEAQQHAGQPNPSHPKPARARANQGRVLSMLGSATARRGQAGSAHRADARERCPPLQDAPAPTRSSTYSHGWRPAAFRNARHGHIRSTRVVPPQPPVPRGGRPLFPSASGFAVGIATWGSASTAVTGRQVRGSPSVVRRLWRRRKPARPSSVACAQGSACATGLPTGTPRRQDGVALAMLVPGRAATIAFAGASHGALLDHACRGRIGAATARRGEGQSDQECPVGGNQQRWLSTRDCFESERSATTGPSLR